MMKKIQTTNKINYKNILGLNLLCLKIYFIKHLNNFISFLLIAMFIVAITLFLLIVTEPNDQLIFQRLFLLLSILFYSSFCLALPLSFYQKLKIEKFSRYAPPYDYETKFFKTIYFIVPVFNLSLSLLLSVLNFFNDNYSDTYVLFFSVMGCSSSIIINIFTWIFTIRSKRYLQFSESFYADFEYTSQSEYRQKLHNLFITYEKTTAKVDMKSFSRYCLRVDKTEGTHYFHILYYVSLIVLFQQMYHRKNVNNKLNQFVKIRNDSIYKEIENILDSYYKTNKAIFNYL